MSIPGTKPLFTAVATATGGRNGHSAAEDGSVAVDLSVPKAMGGPGKPNTTTPEHLFATGYAACFGGALDFDAILFVVQYLVAHPFIRGMEVEEKRKFARPPIRSTNSRAFLEARGVPFIKNSELRLGM